MSAERNDLTEPGPYRLNQYAGFCKVALGNGELDAEDLCERLNQACDTERELLDEIARLREAVGGLKRERGELLGACLATLAAYPPSKYRGKHLPPALEQQIRAAIAHKEGGVGA